ncbi:MAG: hypothetical protein AAFU80_14900 [Pseudomonadota bacterium]
MSDQPAARPQMPAPFRGLAGVAAPALSDDAREPAGAERSDRIGAPGARPAATVARRGEDLSGAGGHGAEGRAESGLEAELHSMLTRLAEPEAERSAGPAGRAVAAVPPLGLVSGVLQEIDETVMARRLVLTNRAGGVLALEVGNRRLLEVDGRRMAGRGEGGANGHTSGQAGRGSGPSGEGPGLASLNLTFAGGQDLADLRQALVRFCAEGGVRVERHPSASTRTLEQTGVAVSTLALAWAKGTEAEEGGEGLLPALFDAASGDVRAAVLMSGEAVLDTAGLPSLVEALSALLATDTPQRLRNEAATGPEAIALSGDRRLLFMAFDGADAVALAAAPDREPALRALWLAHRAEHG